MLALGAAVEAGRIYLMPGGPQPVRNRLPNPAALVRAVDQNKSRHYTISSRFLNVRIAVGPALIPGTKPLAALQGEMEGPRRGSAGRVEVGGPPELLIGPLTLPSPPAGGGEGKLRGPRGKFRWPSIPASYVDRDARHEIGI